MRERAGHHAGAAALALLHVDDEEALGVRDDEAAVGEQHLRAGGQQGGRGPGQGEEAPPAYQQERRLGEVIHGEAPAQGAACRKVRRTARAIILHKVQIR